MPDRKQANVFRSHVWLRKRVIFGMGYYRAALAAASTGDMTSAARLARCSIALGEAAPSAVRLLELLRQRDTIDIKALDRLRALTGGHKYKKALKLKLPRSSRAHAIRGLLYAKIGRYRKSRDEFALALALDNGNALAKQVLFGYSCNISSATRKPFRQVFLKRRHEEGIESEPV